MTWLLDTSAVLVHLMDDPGADQVEAILLEGGDEVALAAPVWAELERRLGEIIHEPDEANRIFRHFTGSNCAFIPVDQESVLATIRIRRACSTRLPLVDALIAGCAAVHDLTLVHRDHHMDAIPQSELRTLRLPDRV